MNSHEFEFYHDGGDVEYSELLSRASRSFDRLVVICLFLTQFAC